MSGGHKELDKIAKKVGKGQKEAAKAAIKSEERLQAVINKTVAAMHKKLRESNNNHKSIQKEISLLGKLEKKLTSIRKNRHALGHKTMRERMSELGNKQVGTWGGVGRWGLAAAGAGVGIVAGAALGQIGSAYSAYTQFGQAQSNLVGMGGRYNAFGSTRYGYDALQTTQHAQGVGRATGNIGAVGTAQAASRIMGADVGEATGWMATLRAAGSKFGNKGGAGAEELKKIIALGMESGIERARLPENIAGVMNLMQRQRGVSAGDFSGAGFAQFMAALGRSGLSGFQGSAGGNVAATIDAAIRGGGGGDAGQALLLQSFGFGKPGGGSSYMDALRSQEQGLSDPNNFTNVMKELTSQFGAGDERTLAMKNLFGTSISQSEELSKLYDNGKMGTEELTKLKDIALAAEPVEKQALKAMQSGFGTTAKYLAGLQNELISKGSQIAGSIRELQTMFNDFVKVLWPGVVKSLKFIVDVLKDIREVITLVWGNANQKQALKIEEDAARLNDPTRKVRVGDKVAQYQHLGRYVGLVGLEQQAMARAERERRHATLGAAGTTALYNQATTLAQNRGRIAEDAIGRVSQLNDITPALRTRAMDAIQYAGTARGGQALGQGPEVRQIVDAVLRAVDSNAATATTLAELLQEQRRSQARNGNGITPATAGAAPPRNPSR